MSSKYLEPTSKGFRQPLDLNQHNGQIYNTPRTSKFGGYDKIKEAHGLFKNTFAIKRPGGAAK